MPPRNKSRMRDPGIQRRLNMTEDKNLRDTLNAVIVLANSPMVAIKGALEKIKSGSQIEKEESRAVLAEIIEILETIIELRPDTN